MGSSPSVREARQYRRDYWDLDPEGFKEDLREEVGKLRLKAKRKGLKPCARLNATADICWERKFPELFEVYQDVQFYDYTKAPVDIRPYTPRNYHLTYSWSPRWSYRDVEQAVMDRYTVAAPFAPFDAKDKGTLPKVLEDIPVTDGDEHDLTFLHSPGSLLGLRFKGRGGSRPLWKPGCFALPF